MEITVPLVREVSVQAWNDIENICKFICEEKPTNLEANRVHLSVTELNLDFYMLIAMSDCA
jgi:hypothetical protein